MNRILKSVYNIDIVYSLTDNFFKLIGKCVNLKKVSRKPIIISGAPRSGTTWLAELFCQDTEGLMYWEPFHLRNQKDLQKMGFTWRPVIKPGDNNPKYQKIFKEIIECKRANRHLLSKIRPPDIFRYKFWVIKFVRANGILHWLLDNFDLSDPLVIIRHPCAVISSQIYRRTEHGTDSEKNVLKEIRNGIPNHAKEFLEYYPEYRNIFEKVKSWEEYLAVLWSMDNYHLFQGEKKKIVIIPYEKLFLNGEKTIKTLFKHYKLKLNQNVLKNLKKPSSTVTEGSTLNMQKKNPLSKWQNHLDHSQIKKIFEIIDVFGLKVYSREIEPNYEMLNQYSLIEF